MRQGQLRYSEPLGNQVQTDLNAMLAERPKETQVEWDKVIVVGAEPEHVNRCARELMVRRFDRLVRGLEWVLPGRVVGKASHSH